MSYYNFAVIIPFANESPTFMPFTEELEKVLTKLNSGKVYLIVDNASKDNTITLCRQLSAIDSRFITLYEPKNKNVVDAYLRGFAEACKNKPDYIIEMDAGLSHDPAALPLFLDKLDKGYDCVFGSRFIKGGSITDVSNKRLLLSKAGTFLSNLLLGTSLHDMTSGYQGFRLEIAEKIVRYPLRSKAHFYQTEIRYLLRNKWQAEIPISYKSPSPSVSLKAISNSIFTLLFYFGHRLLGKAKMIS